MNTISNMDDIIDSRDVIERIEELTEEREDLQESVDGAQEAIDEALEDSEDGKVSSDLIMTRLAHQDALSRWDEENAEELKALQELAEQAEGNAPDWEYGEALIRDSYFETYAQELAEDCGMVSNGDTWPNRCIDWKQAAEELQMDYTSVEFDGVTYWIR